MFKKKKHIKKEKTFVKKNNYALELQGVEYRYRQNYPNAIDNVSFKIEHGKYIAIIGHNGSGKSTLSKLIIGVLNAQKGEMSIFGNLVTKDNYKKAHKYLGIVFQNPDNQFIGSTVRDDIAFGLENQCIDPQKMPEIIERVAKMVRMEDYLDHEPLWLSGGQKQRVAIASVLALEPDIIIFDEATSMLDPRGKREVKEIMVKLRNQRDKTIISITHDMDEILNADLVIVMNGGKLVRYDRPEVILQEEQFLQSIKLDIPFVLKIAKGLKKQGIKIDEVLNEDELVMQLCQKK